MYGGSGPACGYSVPSMQPSERTNEWEEDEQEREAEAAAARAYLLCSTSSHLLTQTQRAPDAASLLASLTEACSWRSADQLFANAWHINSPERVQSQCQNDVSTSTPLMQSRGGTRGDIREPSVDVCSLISMYSV